MANRTVQITITVAEAGTGYVIQSIHNALPDAGDIREHLKAAFENVDSKVEGWREDIKNA